MFFYRVQHKNGAGPFCGSSITEKYDRAAHIARVKLGHISDDNDGWEWSILDHPSPYDLCEESTPLGIFWREDTPDKYKHLFGFVSWQQLRNVFKYTYANKVCTELYVYIYDLPAHEVVQGSTQAVVHRDNLTDDKLHDVIPLADVDGLY